MLSFAAEPLPPRFTERRAEGAWHISEAVCDAVLVAFRARFRFRQGADEPVAGEVITPEPLGLEPVWGNGFVEPSSYLTARMITLSNYMQVGADHCPSVIVQAPRGGCGKPSLIVLLICRRAVRSGRWSNGWSSKQTLRCGGSMRA